MWLGATTEVEPARQGMVIALQLGGLAKALAREMDQQQLAFGIYEQDPQNPQQQKPDNSNNSEIQEFQNP